MRMKVSEYLARHRNDILWYLHKLEDSCFLYRSRSTSSGLYRFLEKRLQDLLNSEAPSTYNEEFIQQCEKEYETYLGLFILVFETEKLQ